MYKINDDALFIETDIQIKSITHAIKTGLYTTWDAARIKGAFSFGNGSIPDFIKYAKDNKHYCNVFDLKTGKKIN